MHPVPLADIADSTHHPTTIIIDGQNVHVRAIRAVRHSHGAVSVQITDDETLTEELDTDGLTEWARLVMAIDDHGSHGVWATYSTTPPGWWEPTTYPQPIGIHEVADMLDVARNTVDSWRHRGLMPEPDWTVGGRPAWDAATIREWAQRTGRWPAKTEKGEQ